MTSSPPWGGLLAIAVLFAIGTAFRLAIYVENGHTFHDAGPVLLGIAVTSGVAVWTAKELSRVRRGSG